MVGGVEESTSDNRWAGLGKGCHSNRESLNYWKCDVDFRVNPTLNFRLHPGTHFLVQYGLDYVKNVNYFIRKKAFYKIYI